jgi:hypothetical protein
MEKSKLTETEKGQTGEEQSQRVKLKSKSMLIIYFHIRATVRKEFVLAGQTINSAYYHDFYGDCLKM